MAYSDVLFLSMAFGDSHSKSYEKYALPTQKEYALNNNFDFELIKERKNSKRHVTWQKIVEIKKRIFDYNFVVWLDSDVMIMNQIKNIFDYHDQSSNLTISEDLDYRKVENDKIRVNTGIMIWKGGQESKEMLEKIWSADNWYVNNPEKHPYEQGSLMWSIKRDENYSNKVNVDNTGQLSNYWYPASSSLKMEDVLLNNRDPSSIERILYDSPLPKKAKTKAFKETLDRNLLFERDDFLVHFAGIQQDERNRLYRRFSNHVRWHE